MKVKLSHIIQTTALVASMACGNNAQAAFVTYSDATLWGSAVGAVFETEDFNAFTVDTTFINSTLSVNKIKISGPDGFNGQITNKIDVSAFEFGNIYNINETPFLLADLKGTQSLRIDFNQAISAWGASFRGISNAPRETTISAFDASNHLLGTINPYSALTDTLGFYGFTLEGNEAASYLIVQNLTPSEKNVPNDVFGIDNVKFVISTPVPEPSTFALLGLGLCAITFIRKTQTN